MQLDDSQLAVQSLYRRYMTEQLEPLTADFESGEVSVFPFMRKMVDELGIAAGADALERTGGSEKSSSGSSDPDPEARALADYAQTQFIVELARVNPGFCMSFGVTLGLCGGNIRTKGTPEQVAKYVPPLMRVEKIGCWCLTEPGAGSDAFGAMRTTVKRDGDDFVLNGSKTFITNGPEGDIFLVYARSEDDGSIQAYIVEREFEGLTTGPAFKKMGMKSSPTSEVFFDSVRVPAENLLGGGSKDRDHVRKSLARERVGIAVMGYGIAERCFEIARDYAKERVQGGQPIRIAYSTGSESALDACAAKLYLAEVGTRVAEHAIHILAGNGYMEEYVVERLLRDAMLLELGGGTTEIQILTIARHILAE
ncbi:MAG: acyl-CoA dehydrogenase family protein [Deltaproteobacteria bacterium]|nr:acyl-CoA dehydrogenase family protein [Deltaproteobacteria bacterium]